MPTAPDNATKSMDQDAHFISTKISAEQVSDFCLSFNFALEFSSIKVIKGGPDSKTSGELHN